MNKTAFKAPHLDTLMFHLTFDCTHNCPMCYAAGEKNKRKKPDLATIKNVLSTLADEGVKTVLFVGGDPGAYPHIIEVAKFAKARGLSANILSNTLELPDAKDIKKDIKVFDSVGSTIHAESAAAHDKFCGVKGAYDKVVERLKLASDAGVDVILTINVVKGNEDKLSAIVKNVMDRGVNVVGVDIQRISQTGRAAGDVKYEVYNIPAAMGQLDKLEKMGLNITLCDAMPLCAVPKKYWHLVQRCDFGVKTGTIDYEGNLGRCGCTVQYDLGNVLEDPAQALWAKSATLNDFRAGKHLDSTCRECDNVERCGGGCALTRAGKLSPDAARKKGGGR